jgi:hypothetical protein
VPEPLVQALLQRFRLWWPALEEQRIGTPERIHFRLPRAIEAAEIEAAALHD